MGVPALIAHSCFSLFSCLSCPQAAFQRQSSPALSKHQQSRLTSTSASLCYHLPRVYQLKPEQVVSLDSAVRISQGHQEDVSGDSQLATAAKAACCIIIGETVRTRDATYKIEGINQQSQNAA